MANSPAPGIPVTGTPRHVGFFYVAHDEYARTVTGFLRTGLAEGEALFVAVPAARLSLVKEALGRDVAHVEWADMTQMGRNPAWIIPRIRAFIERHAGRRVRYVGEPAWASRSAAELREATRHEALINLAFDAADAQILCPYDTAALDPAVIADARRTHPLVLSDGHQEANPGYAVPFEIPSTRGEPLSAPCDAMSHTYRANLSEVRALVHTRARAAGMSEARASDLVLAVSEVAANTLRHTRSSGTLDIWQDQDEVICEVRDTGTITDPLAGRRMPSLNASGGHGLWLVNQVCDLVELRSDAGGTTVRMHMSVNPSVTGS